MLVQGTKLNQIQREFNRYCSKHQIKDGLDLWEMLMDYALWPLLDEALFMETFPIEHRAYFSSVITKIDQDWSNDAIQLVTIYQELKQVFKSAQAKKHIKVKPSEQTLDYLMDRIILEDIPVFEAVQNYLQI